MAKGITQYDLLISCPGDIQTEIACIESAVADFNERYSDALGITVRTRHWKKSAYSQSGDKPQALLNRQFAEGCDAAVALLWTRFGTPTDKYGSGTEEEIELMLNAGKQVFMYFSDKPILPSKHDAAEYARVQAFREKYRNKGLYFTYDSDEAFSKLFAAHLAQHFLSLQKLDELQQARAPKLLLRGIDETGALCEKACVQPFGFQPADGTERIMERISGLFHSIAGMHVGGQTPDSEDRPFLSLPSQTMKDIFPPVVIAAERKDLILAYAQRFEFALPEDFFDLGTLRRDRLTAADMLGGSSFRGSVQEKEKYDLLQDLYAAILKFCDWSPVEEAFSGIPCIKLALENCGTAIDEDIEVAITLKAEEYLPLAEYPQLDGKSKEYLLRECDMDALFGLSDTARYADYASSVLKTTYTPGTPPSHPFSNVDIFETDYTEEYEEALSDIFCYSTYREGDNYILKIKFDHIKHHTAIAFPAALLLKKAPASIHYTISSRNAAEVTVGSMAVGDAFPIQSMVE